MLLPLLLNCGELFLFLVPFLAPFPAELLLLLVMMMVRMRRRRCCALLALWAGHCVWARGWWAPVV